MPLIFIWGYICVIWRRIVTKVSRAVRDVCLCVLIKEHQSMHTEKFSRKMVVKIKYTYFVAEKTFKIKTFGMQKYRFCLSKFLLFASLNLHAPGQSASLLHAGDIAVYSRLGDSLFCVYAGKDGCCWYEQIFNVPPGQHFVIFLFKTRLCELHNLNIH